MLKVAKCIQNLQCSRNYAKIPKSTNTNQGEMKYLNVAEKNDAAKTIAGLLSNGTARRREGYSVYNKIFDFEATVKGSKCKMVMTSVSGHLLNFAFLQSYRNWKNVDPISLFDAPIRKSCSEDYQPIKRTLEREVRGCSGLIIWTDCDREGENIGFEIIEVCRAIKPNISVYRAIFSEITSTAIRRALQQLKVPDKRQSEAVDVRSELDLRTGAAITRFQTMRLQRLFPNKIADKLISYGSCQIPTLGFVAERYKEIEAFVSEPFWKIKVIHTIDDLTVEFHWARNRLFDKQACEDYFLLCIGDPKATVESVTVKNKSKWRPMPMDTVELEKLGSRKLKLSAKETMTIAEKLYTKGIISYPRTETNQFSKEMDLRSLVELQTGHSIWGEFAQRVMDWGPNPRNGNKSDQAHPPIHPTKLETNLSGNDARVYELVCRHFLACVSKDAVGTETVVGINIAGEKFTATGLVILERNYLDVYVYDKWNAKQIHNYTQGQVFEPTEISMPEGNTTPPSLLTEADLIALMEKNGIGTDATHAEHINTIKERGYIGVVDNGFLVPGVIGMGLYEGYDAMQLALAKPVLRAEFELDLKKICLGEKDPKVVLKEQIIKYKEAYKQIMEKIKAMDEKMAMRIDETPAVRSSNNSDNTAENLENTTNCFKEIFQCPKCGVAPMALKPLKNQTGHMIGCLSFPDCRNVIWLPKECHEPSVKDEICPNCGEGYKMLKFKFATMYYKTLFNAPSGWYKTCLRCDTKFRETFDINLENVKRVGAIVGTIPSNTLVTNRPTNTNSNDLQRTSQTSSSENHTSSATNIRNKKKPTGNENTLVQPKRTKKPTTTSNQAKATNTKIRSYFTSASSETNQHTINNRTNTTTVDPTILNDIDDIFNSNDSFNVIMPEISNDCINNTTENPRAENSLNLDIAAAFENDDDDWSLVESSTITAEIPTATVLNGTINQDDRPSSSHMQNDINDSISDLFRNEIDYSNFSWGSTNRSTHTDKEPNRKKPRLEKSQSANTPTPPVEVTDSPSNVTGSTSYLWGSASRASVTTHGVKCTGCHQEAKELSVKKDGPNKGRLFYVCPKDKQCNFFQWSDEQTTATTALKEENTPQATLWGSSQDSWGSQSWGTTSQSSSAIERASSLSRAENSNPTSKSTAASSSNSIDDVKCNCNIPASSLTVRKEGPNKGRSFYGCAQRSCGFFQWGDNNDGQASTSSAANSSHSNRSWGTGNPQNNNSNVGGNGNTERDAKKRKCGLCRQEGHTKQKCPRKAEFDYLF